MLITSFVPGIRAQRCRHLRRLLRIAGRRAGLRVRDWRERIAQAGRYRHDLAMLLADDRMLRDIGLTRADDWSVVSPVAVMRDKADDVAGEQSQPVPHIDAPSLVPSLPLPAAHENFR